jgi:hypothetical protein
MHPNIIQRGVRARIKLPKLVDSIFNNQQKLEAAMIGSGGWRGWEAMTTNDNDGNNTWSLNYNILIRGRGRCGMRIIGGIGSTHVAVVGIPAIKV